MQICLILSLSIFIIVLLCDYYEAPEINILYFTLLYTLKGQSHEKICEIVPLNDRSCDVPTKVRQKFLKF
jgi:hypothetical protein